MANYFDHNSEEEDETLSTDSGLFEDDRSLHIKKRSHQESHDDGAHAHEEGESWLMSYADLVTNLLLFFVVMYSISNVDNDKFQMMAAAINNIKPQKIEARRDVEVIINDEKAKTSAENAEVMQQIQTLMQKLNPSVLEKDKKLADETAKAKAKIAEMFYVTPGENPQKDLFEIVLAGTKYFDKGSPTPTQMGYDALKALALQLQKVQENVSLFIEGHVDAEEVPEGPKKVALQWELSAKRAVAVMSILESLGVESARMSVAGFSQKVPPPPDTASGAEAVIAGRRVHIRVTREENHEK